MTMQVEYTELKNMYFDKKVSDYFRQVFDIPAKNTADCQALMKGQIKDISAEDLTPEVKEIVSICHSLSVSSCCSLSLSLSFFSCDYYECCDDGQEDQANTHFFTCSFDSSIYSLHQT